MIYKTLSSALSVHFTYLHGRAHSMQLRGGVLNGDGGANEGHVGNLHQRGAHERRQRRGQQRRRPALSAQPAPPHPVLAEVAAVENRCPRPSHPADGGHGSAEGALQHE